MAHSLTTACALLALLGSAGAAEPQHIPVPLLGHAPQVDGNLDEWGEDGWQRIAIAPTVKPEQRAELGLSAEDRNAVGRSEVAFKAGVAGDTFYVAVRWPDDGADTDLDVWLWNGHRYARSRRYNDQFALRFAMAGDYDRSMLSGKSYEADLWEWNASRGAMAGIAEDFRQVISTRIIENAAEYTVKGVGTIYIKKYRDEGHYPFKTVRPPRQKGADQIVAQEMKGGPDGSYADVRAGSRWQDGYWQLEMSRKLDTGHADDVVLPRGGRIVGQIAVFNHSADENKSISEPLDFDFSAVKQ